MTSAWLVSKRFDFWVFFPLWLLVVLGIVYQNADAESVLGQPFGHIFFWLYLLFLSLPHMSYSFYLAWGVTEVRESPTKNNLLFKWLPISIFIFIFGNRVLFARDATNFFYILSAIIIVWGSVHVGMQNFGILQIYRRRNDIEADRVHARLEKVMLVMTGLLVTFRFPFYDNESTRTNTILEGIGVITVVLILILLGIHVFRSVRKGLLITTPWQIYGFLFYSVFLMFLAYGFVAYDRNPKNDVMAYLIYSTHHAVCYLGLTYFLQTNRSSQKGSGVFRSLKSFLRFYLPHFLVSLPILVIPFSYYAMGDQVPFDPDKYNWLLAIFALHCYVEGFIWKFRNPKVRATVGRWIKIAG